MINNIIVKEYVNIIPRLFAQRHLHVHYGP